MLKKQLFHLLNNCWGWGLLLGSSLFCPEAVVAAEKIFLNYGPLSFSLSVKSLETYADKGKIEVDFQTYARFLEPEQLTSLRKALVTKADIDHITIAQFLYSPQGETILLKLGEVIKTSAGQNGFYGIRSALILAAADPEGLTPLNILRWFPTKGIVIASEEGLEILESITSTINQTRKAIAMVQYQAIKEGEQFPQELSSWHSNLPSAIRDDSTFSAQFYRFIPDLRQPGPVTFSSTTLTMSDVVRSRFFPVDLYLPQTQSQQKLPVVVISHGLGSQRQTFAYLATHLASHGFAVIVPEHPESNSEQIQALLSGLANQVTPAEELLNRPLDISFVLDELESQWGDELNLDQVAMIGQSFGGYTSLALAGAKLNNSQLEKACQLSNNSLNLSLLLQCLGLKLPQTQPNLSDRRIAAVIAINPLTSSIFGQEQLQQLQIPVMLISSSNDPVTPALTEQIIPFNWLQSPDKYLLLAKNATHFSFLDEESGSIPVPKEIIGPDPQIAQTYLKAIALAFVQTHLAQVPKYQTYLHSGYGQYLSQQAMPLSLVTYLPENPQ